MALSLPRRSRAPLWIGVALFAIEMALAGRYGVFRDELYYVACGRHLAFGYVDHPPLVAVMARVTCAVLGDSVLALRVMPAACAAGIVWIASELARTLGGGRFAQTLTAVCVAVVPEFLGMCHFLSMNCVLPVAWTAAALFVVRGVARGETRAWVGFGLACGVALLAKHSTLFFGAGVALGVAVTPARRVLGTRGPWIGLAIAVLMLAPNLAWQQVHGWPTLEFMHNAQTKKMVRMGALAFVHAQIDDMHPLTLPVWLAGTGWLLLTRRARLLGVAFVATCAVVVLGGGKPYYVAPVFPVALAAGGVAIERWIANRWARAAIVGALVAGGAAAAPMAIPVLDEPAFIRYAAVVDPRPASDEKHERGLLPQFQADQHGWEALATRVARAYASLAPEEQRVATIYGGNYGEAGAVDYFGPRWGLPPAVSGHNTYGMWGPPRDGRGEVMIAVGGFHCDDWSNVYADIRQVDETDEPYAMPYENHIPVCVLRGLKEPLDRVWLRLRHYI
jgi:4-amino-4-deoxy-L-arabinose transferase-like glycosyltransferase